MFVIDARAGLTPSDRAFTDFARRANKPVILLANKSEGKHGEAGAMEAYALGLGEPVQISAEHGEGMSDLYDALRGLMPEPAEEDEESTMTRSPKPTKSWQNGRSASRSSAVPTPANPR